MRRHRRDGADAEHAEVERLEPFVGEWNLEVGFAEARAGEGRARVTFEWMPGKRFLIQRWEVPDPGSAGVAIIGFDREKESYLQHYFDARGVARLYEMGFSDGVWKLWRSSPDFSPLDFSQRFTGTFSDDGERIEGRWEISHDHSTWEKDFDMTYTKVN